MAHDAFYIVDSSRNIAHAVPSIVREAGSRIRPVPGFDADGFGCPVETQSRDFETSGISKCFVIERGPAAGFRDPVGSVWLRVCRFEILVVASKGSLRF
jgi:hypothetical protein